jgi:hypothetical protein
MNKDRHSSDPLFPGFEPPGPPEVLQRRVLREAAAAFSSDSAPDRWTRIWESPVARLAWALSVLVLVACHIAVTPLGSGRTRTEHASSAGLETGRENELLETVAIPRLDVDATPCGGDRYSRMLCRMEADENDTGASQKESES